MKERKLGLAKRLSAFALAFVMVFSLLATFNVSALAADEDVAPTLNPGWTYNGQDDDLILAPGEAADSDNYLVYYAATETTTEPNEPTSSNLGEWTLNWRDDDRFLVKKAGDYYVWWCVYDADEDDFSTEPEMVGKVTVDKATPLGVAPTGTVKEYTGEDIELLGTPGMSLDGLGHYEYTVTDAKETDPSNYNWGPVAYTEKEVGEYKVWYQLKYDGTETDNYEDGTIGYVESEIAAKKLTLKNPSQSVYYAGANKTPMQKENELVFVNAAGADVTSNVTLTIAKKQADLTKTGADTWNTLSQAIEVIAGEKNYKIGTYTVYYSAELTGYETITGKATVTIVKQDELTAKATLTAPTVITPTAATDAGVQLITNAATLTANLDGENSTVYYAVNQSGKFPSTSSLSNWETEANNIKATKAGTYYVYYMVANDKNSNIKPSAVQYKTVTLYDDTYDTATASTLTATAKDDLTYDGTNQTLLKDNKITGAQSGATVQYILTQTPGMPAANSSDWTTYNSSKNITAKNAGTYYIWYRQLEYKNGKTLYVETTPECTPVTIKQADAAEGTDYKLPKKIEGDNENLTYSGRSQALFNAGKGNKGGLYWMYGVFVDPTDSTNPMSGTLVSLGTTVPKMTDVDTYYVMGMLIDPSYTPVTNELGNVTYSSNYSTKGYENYCQKFGVGIVGAWTSGETPYQTIKIEQLVPTVEDPELVDDLTYTGEDQNLIATPAKKTNGNAYYLVVDEDSAFGEIVSTDGKAKDAGNYEVYTMVTDKTATEVALQVYKANIVAMNSLKTEKAVDALTVINVMDEEYGGICATSNIWYEPESAGTVTIEQAIPEFLVDIDPASVEYNGNYQSLGSEGLVNGGRVYYMAYDEDNEPVWAEPTRILPMAKEMGKYTISYYITTPDWETNFEEVEETELAEPALIAAGSAEVTTAPQGVQAYVSGQPIALATAGEAKDGTMVYALGSPLFKPSYDEWSTEIPTATEAGTYYVWYKAAGNEGFADSEATYVEASLNEESTLYRIFNPATGEHIYTYDANEVAALTAPGGGWSLDGTVSGTAQGTEAMYRLEDLVHPGLHIYSNDQNEIDTLVAAGVAKVEGVQFMTVPKGPGTQDYYRLSSPSFPHHYTADQNEINSLIASGVYTLDGYAWSFPGTSN